MEKIRISVSTLLTWRIRILVILIFIGLMGFLILSQNYSGRYRLDSYLFRYPPLIRESVRLVFSVGTMIGYYFLDKSESIRK